MADIWRNFRRSVRTLLKQRAFAAGVVLTLALGIGINTAVFSVVDAVLFRPLPFAQPGRLVEVWEQEPGHGFSMLALRRNQIVTWSSQHQVFERVETYELRSFVAIADKEPESIVAAAVTPGMFAMLGVVPCLGRSFAETDALPGNDRVVILSDAFWKTRFGADPAVIGRTVLLSDQQYAVVGVMPAKFKFPYRVSTFWVPLTQASAERTNGPGRRSTVARLKDGMALSTAQEILDSLAPRLAAERPDLVWKVKLWALDDHRVNSRPRQALIALLGAVAFVLLLACANAANLLLARATERQREMAVRLALGASRGQIVRLLLGECLILAVAGGTLGSLLAGLGIDALARMVPSELTFLTVANIDMDPRVLTFTIFATLLTAVGFGLVPALRLSSPDLRSALGGASGPATADRAQSRLRNSLVVIQVALSLTLLVGAGLMMRSFLGLSREAPGFDPENLIAADLSLPEHRYPTGELQKAFFGQLKTAFLEAPGVESVTLASGAPPAGGGIQFNLDIEVEGRAPIAKDTSLILPFAQVDGDYFRTLRIPILRGQPFPAETGGDTQARIVVSEAMARYFWPNEDPVGQRIRFSKGSEWQRVVGVAGDVVHGRPGSRFSRMAVYYPWGRREGRLGQQTVLVRTIANARKPIPEIKGLIARMDKDQPMQRVDTVEMRLSEALAEPRFYLRIFGVFALLTLLLVSMGIYGVMAHTVARRTSEIGLRQALGAGRQDVFRLVFKQGLSLTLSGLVVGAVVALSMSRVMAAFLFGSPAVDPPTYALVGLLIVAVALGACWIPALRAARIDPADALRHE